MRKGYKKIEVYFPDAEYEAFLKKVKRTNLSISAFVRKMAAEQVIREAPHADVPYLMREVKRVGNNINQFLFLANSKRFFDKAALKCKIRKPQKWTIYKVVFSLNIAKNLLIIIVKKFGFCGCLKSRKSYLPQIFPKAFSRGLKMC